jgi:hypothetical protein
LSGANLDQHVVRTRRNHIDDAADDIRIDQEVLTETLSRPVTRDHVRASSRAI